MLDEVTAILAQLVPAKQKTHDTVDNISLLHSFIRCYPHITTIQLSNVLTELNFTKELRSTLAAHGISLIIVK